MFLLSLILLKGIRKRAFDLFLKEQTEANRSLQELSAAERKKAIMNTFKSLSTGDYEKLKVRVGALEKQEPSKGKTGTSRSKALKSLPKISLYDFFVKEQSGSPSITVLNNPRDRELVLFEIFNNLPAKAKKALEKRAAEYSAYRAARLAYYEAKSNEMVVPLPRDQAGQDLKKTSASKRSKNSSGPGKVGSKSKRGKSPPEGGAERARVVSPFASFVKAEIPKVRDLPLKERMKELARRWRGLGETERARYQTPRPASTAKPASKDEGPLTSSAEEEGGLLTPSAEEEGGPLTSSTTFLAGAGGPQAAVESPKTAAGRGPGDEAESIAPTPERKEAVGEEAPVVAAPVAPPPPLEQPSVEEKRDEANINLPKEAPESGSSDDNNTSEQDNLKKKMLKRKLFKKKKGTPPPRKAS